MKDKKIFFPNLDGLRFVAFMMVFVWHALKAPFDLLHIENPFVQKFFYYFLNGKTGVSIFFVLSGFLITYLILAEIELNGKLDVLKFYIRRSLRIWPLYFLVLLLVFVGMPIAMRFTGANWSEFDMRPLFYFLFIGNFDVLRIYLTNGTDLLPSTVTWSVAIEEQFYFAWPLFFTLLPAKFFKYIFPVVLFGSYIFRSMHAGSSPTLNFHTLSVAGDLALGGLAAYLSFTDKNFVNFFKGQSNKLRGLIYIGGMLLLYSLQFLEDDGVHVYSRLIQTLFFAYIILDQNFCLQERFKFSASKFMSYWGKYTYGLYLWHPFLLLVITILFTKVFHLSYQNVFTHLLIAPIALAASFTVSYASYHYFEKHFLKLKNRFAFIRKD